jgi:hypothetical protein
LPVASAARNAASPASAEAHAAGMRPPRDNLALRPQPAPLSSPAADGEPSEGSYESLFRSTGELDPQTAHPSSLVDIAVDDDEARVDADDAPDSRYLSFVQQAEREARWQRPGVRLALAAGSVALALLLLMQLALAERDQLAARWPALKPTLESLCGVLGCRIEALRRIDRLAVESSGLTRIGEAQVYRLAMVLHNRAEWPLMLPAVDLTLTDSGGAVVSRRVLNSRELGVTAPTIAPGQELPLQVLLRSNDRPITGYTIEIFYP